MSRRLAVAAIVGPALFTVGVAIGYWSGFLHPVLTTAKSILQPKPCNEADWPA